MGELQLRSPVAMRRRSEDGTTASNGAGGVGPADKPIPEQILQPGSDDNISILSSGDDAVIDLIEDNTFYTRERYLLAANDPRTFTWNLNSSVEVTEIQWRSDRMLEGVARNPEVIAIAHRVLDAGASAPEFTSNRDFFQVYRDRGLDLMKAELQVSSFNSIVNLTEHLGGRMTLLIDWKTDMATGTTISGIFTVVENDQQGLDWKATNFPEDDSEEAKQEKENGKVRITYDDKQMHIAPTTGLATTSATSSAPAIEAPSGVPLVVADASPNSGLSTGVIAGIAVGAAAFFIILITAIFLLYRRRHRRRVAAEQAGYDSQQGATVYFADKETSRLPETPPTPYSEDGGHRLPSDHVLGVPAGQQQQSHDGIQQDQQESHLRNTSDSSNTTFVPYKNPEPATSRTDLAMRSGTITPLGVSANIAHLVEDGMTEADLRRLEEEERQLDDAIAQARRR